MGRVANDTIRLLNTSEPPATKHAAAEAYLYRKIDPSLTQAQNRLRLQLKCDALEQSLGSEAQAIVRHERLRFENNLPFVIGRKALGATGRNIVYRINKATYAAQVETLTKQYLEAKVTSLKSEADNRICLQSKRDALLANVAVSCAPYVLRAAEACIRDIPTLRTRHAAQLRNKRSSGGSYTGGSSFGGA